MSPLDELKQKLQELKSRGCDTSDAEALIQRQSQLSRFADDLKDKQKKDRQRSQ